MAKWQSVVVLVVNGELAFEHLDILTSSEDLPVRTPQHGIVGRLIWSGLGRLTGDEKESSRLGVIDPRVTADLCCTRTEFGNWLVFIFSCCN